MDKAALRKALRTLRAGIEADQKRRWDAAIGKQLLAWWERQAKPTAALGVYWPLKGEPDLQETYVRLAQAGVQLALPVVLEKHQPLRFAQWTPGEPMVEDSMGVAIPAALRWIERPAAVVVPCLGFNDAGFRLGYGGGFYDRTLAPLPRPASVGVCYACQRAVFSVDAHDVALDLVITE